MSTVPIFVKSLTGDSLISVTTESKDCTIANAVHQFSGLEPGKQIVVLLSGTPETETVLTGNELLTSNFPPDSRIIIYTPHDLIKRPLCRLHVNTTQQKKFTFSFPQEPRHLGQVQTLREKVASMDNIPVDSFHLILFDPVKRCAEQMADVDHCDEYEMYQHTEVYAVIRND